MGELPSSLFFNASMFLLVPLLVAVVFKKNKISPVVGYMLGGIILSNFFSNLTNAQSIDSFAYFGILLLMFTVGLETQFDRMIALKKYIFLGGLLQLTISAFFVGIISSFFGFTFVQSMLIGIALSSSSTTIVAKIIQDKGEEGSFVGEMAMGVLMFQDLAFIPFMVIFNSLTGQNHTPLQVIQKIFVDILFAGGILFFAYYVGRRLAPYIFNKFARLSRELLNLFMILAIFIVAYLSTLLHISPFISIFVAGVIVAQTAEHHHIFSQIRPLRDILSVIFFIYIGMNINLGVLFPTLFPMLLFALVVMLVKTLIIFFIFTSFKFHSKLSTYLALYLFQIDEDAFILMSVAYANKLFTQEQYMFVISAVLISLLFTPTLIAKKEKVYKHFWYFIARFLPFIHNYVVKKIDRERSPIDSLDIKNHIILCGYGRIGSHVGRALLLAEIPFIALDYNFATVEKAKKLGVNAIYGDPTDIDMLDYAECENASAIVLALPDRFAQESIVMNAKKLNKDIIVMTRVHHIVDHKRMKDLGVEVVVQPEFEASLSLIKKIMVLKRFHKDEILKHIAYFKKEHEGL
jgi:CPA2 family monovalent cation:H+ antiporter-2